MNYEVKQSVLSLVDPQPEYGKQAGIKLHYCPDSSMVKIYYNNSIIAVKACNCIKDAFEQAKNELEQLNNLNNE